MRKISVLFCLFIFILNFGQNDRREIKKTVNNFFVAMYNADAQALKNTFSKSVVFQTVLPTGEVKTEDAGKFADGISKFSKGDLHEKINIRNISTDGKLGSVWMGYEFIFKAKTSHCGVNSFQLVKIDRDWKIQYIIDTRGDCQKP